MVDENSAQGRRTRRHDPDRKNRIVEAALTTIAGNGVSGTTHRLIAAAADVSLGSMTYHFSGLADVLEQAFRLHAERMAALYEQHFEEVRDRDSLIEAMTDLVHGNGAATPEDSAITFELYAAAVRDPALRSITQHWMGLSRKVLQRFMNPAAAQGVDALIEGLIIHLILATRPVSRSQTRQYLDQAVGAGSIFDVRTRRK